MDSKENHPKTIKINIEDWQKKLGIELFGNVIVLLSALNKIYALWDLMYLTQKYDRKEITARSARNRCVAITLTMGILHEFYEVLQHICSYIKKNGKTHNKIVSILSVFNQSKSRSLLTDYRDDISVHLGKQVPMSNLIEIAININNLVKYDSDIQRDVYYDFADEIINRAFFQNKYSDLIEESKLQGGKFEDVYKEKMGHFFDYIYSVHTHVSRYGGELLVCIIEEFQLNVKDQD